MSRPLLLEILLWLVIYLGSKSLVEWLWRQFNLPKDGYPIKRLLCLIGLHDWDGLGGDMEYGYAAYCKREGCRHSRSGRPHA
jgi:hypothetical protein